MWKLKIILVGGGLFLFHLLHGMSSFFRETVAFGCSEKDVGALELCQDLTLAQIVNSLRATTSYLWPVPHHYPAQDPTYSNHGKC